jgi:KaiC domain protein
VSDDEDWFERALREIEGDDDDGRGGEDERGEENGGSRDRRRDDGADADQSEGDGSRSDGSGGDGSEGGEGWTVVEGGSGDTDESADTDENRDTDESADTDENRDVDESADTDENRDVDGDERTDPQGDAETSTFSEDFATALRDAPDPGGTGDAGGNLGGFGGDDPFGGGGGGDNPFGGGLDGDDPFDGGGGVEEDVFGDGPETFDDEAFESDIDRTKIGIEGLDEMILGGIPERSLMVAIGSAGTGKTTLGLQFLEHGLDDGGTGVYITLEETRQRILDTAEEKGWSFREYEDEERLAIIDMDPIEMADSLASIRNDMPRLINEFGADRLVMDSVSLLEMMYDHPARRRSEVFNFSRALKKAGVTTMLTSEANSDNPYASRYGIVEYLADAVFILQYVRPSDFQETRLAIEIQKVRDANHSRETKPYEITNEGISVYRRANIF